MINIENFRPLQQQLTSTQGPCFALHSEGKKIMKKSTLHKQHHYQICSLPDSLMTVSGKSSDLTLLIFFDKSTVTISHQPIICMPYSVLFLSKECTYDIQKAHSNGPVFIFDCNAHFFDDVMVSQIADCPIFYDLLSLDSNTGEYLLFDYHKDSSLLLTLHLFLTELIQPKTVTHAHKNYKLLLIVLMTTLDRHHIPYLIIQDSSMMPYYDKGKILKYLSDNFATATLSSTAAHFNFHPTYFSSLFKKMFHESFSKKLLALKLEHTKRLLITTNMTTQEIMTCVGFNDKSYFFKSFKQYYQTTPIQYRKAKKILYKK